jgi:hypothetical protein
VVTNDPVSHDQSLQLATVHHNFELQQGTHDCSDTFPGGGGAYFRLFGLLISVHATISASHDEG